MRVERGTPDYLIMLLFVVYCRSSWDTGGINAQDRVTYARVLRLLVIRKCSVEELPLLLCQRKTSRLVESLSISN